MKSIVTNQELMALANDIKKQSAASLAFHVFHGTKIKQFFQLNKIHLEILDQKIKRLIKARVAHDEKGNPVAIDGLYQFAKPEDQENYEREFKELMQTNCTIHT